MSFDADRRNAFQDLTSIAVDGVLQLLVNDLRSTFIVFIIKNFYG